MNVLLKVSEVQEIVVFSILLVQFGHRLLLRDYDFVLHVDEQGSVIGTSHSTVDILAKIANCMTEKLKS